jgi:hypothetical protein
VGSGHRAVGSSEHSWVNDCPAFNSVCFDFIHYSINACRAKRAEIAPRKNDFLAALSHRVCAVAKELAEHWGSIVE